MRFVLVLLLLVNVSCPFMELKLIVVIVEGVMLYWMPSVVLLLCYIVWPQPLENEVIIEV